MRDHAQSPLEPGDISCIYCMMYDDNDDDDDDDDINNDNLVIKIMIYDLYSKYLK